jgi:pyrroloquinoline quinone biosynthesis protein D
VGPPLNPEAIPALSEGASFSRVGADYVLLDPAGTHLRGLNATGARVWELVDGRRSVQEIAQALASAWSLPAEQALADVRAFLAALAAKGLIR